MSLEIKVYSPKPLLTASEFAASLRKWRLESRFLDGEGEIPQMQPTGPLDGDYVVLAWDVDEKGHTQTVDRALAACDKGPIDELGMTEKLGWCELHGLDYDYAKFWAQFPDEVDEYEQSVPPDQLRRIKSAKSQYWFRSGTTPKHCAMLAEGLARVLVKETGGVKEQ